jgi:outer membrane protein assembly factor BamB
LLASASIPVDGCSAMGQYRFELAFFYVLSNNGVLDAYEVNTGAEYFRARVPQIGSGFSASPVAADRKLFLANEDGSVVVLAADRTFRHLATNDIGEPVMATPALSRGVIFVRGMHSIFAIGRRR